MEKLFPGLDSPDSTDISKGCRLHWPISNVLDLVCEVRPTDGMFSVDLNALTLGGYTDCCFSKSAAMPGRILPAMREAREVLLGQAALFRRMVDNHSTLWSYAWHDKNPQTLLHEAFPGFDVINCPQQDITFVDLGLFRPAIWNWNQRQVQDTVKNADGILLPAKGTSPTRQEGTWTLGILTRWGHFLSKGFGHTTSPVLLDLWAADARRRLQEEDLPGILQACGVRECP